MHDRLVAHLFPGDGDEHGAVIAAGLAQFVGGRLRLLARELHLARDGVDFVAGKRGYKMFRAEFVRDRVIACQEQKLVYLNIHNHGGTTQVQFSGDDLRSHERGYPALLDIAGDLPLGALVFSTQAVAGDIWLPDGRRLTLDRTVIVGKARRVLFPAPPPRADLALALYDRQTRLFGDAGQHILKRAKIAVIGVGSVGALLIEWLARLGIGHFVLIEPERIEVPNLSRFPGATMFDALSFLQGPRSPGWVRALARRWSARKLRIAERVIRRANPTARIELLPYDFLHQGVASQVLDCDYLFLAADSMRARLLFNAIVHQYLIPGVQVGAKVTADSSTGEIASVHAVSRPVNPDGGCLLCNELISASKLQEEGQTERERHAQRYVDDDEITAPSVITLNARAASQAADDFMFYMTGLTSKDATQGYMRFMPMTREVFLDEPRRSQECSECGDGAHSRLGRGDLGPRLPTFHSSPKRLGRFSLWGVMRGPLTRLRLHLRRGGARAA
jgi:hypothetical protein